MRVVNLVRNIPRVSQAITCPTYNKHLVADFLSLMYAVMTVPQRMVMAHLKKLLTRWLFLLLTCHSFSSRNAASQRVFTINSVFRKSLSSYAQESLAMLQMFMSYGESWGRTWLEVCSQPIVFPDILAFYKDLLFCIPNNNARLDKIPVAHGLL